MTKNTKRSAKSNNKEKALSVAHADEQIAIEDFAEPAYLGYAMYTVKDRAIPDIEDGLKPVQRRVLWGMLGLRLLSPSAKPVKSARVVGDVIGKYHPHGDASVYDAMVRLAQPFTLRYPLVEGQGNFGRRDGDSAAAMRYTEAKLSPIAAALLDEMNWDTVDMRPNYDQTETEPETLPAQLPFGLLNGSSGIAVGMATQIPPHNVGELVEAVKKVLMAPKSRPVTLDDVMDVLPGPDFATGARIISSREDLAQIYDTGRGAIRMRATWSLEPRGKQQVVVVDSLPQTTTTAKVMMRINDLVNPQAPIRKGKKQALKPKQVQLKKLFGDMLDEVRDDSDKDHPVRIIITPKTRNVDIQVMMHALCAYTDMECNYPVNMVFVDRQGAPHQGGIMEWLGQWCSYRVDTARRRVTDEKGRIDHRLHILDGRFRVLDALDKVIAIIRASEQPKEDLMEQIGLTEIQAEDILDMRLRAIARLENLKLHEEYEKKTKEQKRLAKLLESPTALKRQIIKEMDRLVEVHGDERRTLIEPEEAIPTSLHDEVLAENLAPDPIAVALTERGWLSWRPAKSQEEALEVDFKIKEGDTTRLVMFGDRGHSMVLLSTTGQAYALRLTDLPSKIGTAPLTQFFSPSADEHFVTARIVRPEDWMVVASTAGYGFITQASSALNRMQAGKAFLTTPKGSSPLPLLPIPTREDGKPEVDFQKWTLLALSSDGRTIAYPLEQVKVLPKGKGVALMGLAPDAHLADIALAPKEDPVYPDILTEKNQQKKTDPKVFAAVMGSRSSSRKGNRLHKQAPNARFVRPGWRFASEDDVKLKTDNS